MNLLLDTHVLMWIFNEPESIRPSTHDALVSGEHATFCSVVNIWEIAIKQSLGKLKLPEPCEAWLPPLLARSEIEIITIESSHAFAVRRLPWHHRDPFDRMLVAQATHEGMTIVTRDRALERYGVPVLAA